MSDSGGDKKHEASDRRREKAREDGQIVKSQDLTSASLLLASIATLWVFGDDAANTIAAGMIEALSEFELAPVTESDGSHRLFRGGTRLVTAAAPMLIAMFAAAVIINLAQTGFLFTTAKLAPKLSHISPAAGIKRILSLQGFMRLGFGVFKVAVISVVAYISLVSDAPMIMNLASLSIGQISQLLFRCLINTCLWIGVALFVLAIAEYAFQKWKHNQDLMMTDQEVRDEMKESQGDPQMAQRRRQIQRQMMMQRAESEVPKADVVVSNPTELAIAIQYDPTTMPAPIVLAKGAGPLAQKIRRIALENSVPVIERKPLAQILYKTVDVGEEVPADQYQAVAEVLRYVYQLKGKKLPATAA